jgi:hypothetical protein
MCGRNENATQASLENRETTAAPDLPAYSLARLTPLGTTKSKTLPIPGIARFLSDLREALLQISVTVPQVM